MPIHRQIRACGLVALLVAASWSSGCGAGAVNAPKVTPGPPAFGPWSSNEQAPALASRPTPAPRDSPPRPPAEENRSNGMIDLAFYLYANYLTRVDAARCNHRPTCSRYAVDALRAHGFVLGPMLTVDRLLRGERSSAIRMLPIEKVEDGQTYFRDHVEDNAFH